jgi:hypothetical protein
MDSKETYHMMIVGNKTMAFKSPSESESLTPSEVVPNDRNTLDYDEVSEGLAEATGVVLTTRQLQELLQDHGNLVSQLHEWGIEDTDLSAEVANLLASQLLGELWPTYGEPGRDVDEFTERLHSAAIAKGYAVR